MSWLFCYNTKILANIGFQHMDFEEEHNSVRSWVAPPRLASLEIGSWGIGSLFY